jgi:hypothetical protein
MIVSRWSSILPSHQKNERACGTSDTQNNEVFRRLIHRPAGFCILRLWKYGIAARAGTKKKNALPKGKYV